MDYGLFGIMKEFVMETKSYKLWSNVWPYSSYHSNGHKLSSGVVIGNDENGDMIMNLELVILE